VNEHLLNGFFLKPFTAKDPAAFENVSTLHSIFCM
jgi:hypothetical protein